MLELPSVNQTVSPNLILNPPRRCFGSGQHINSNFLEPISSIVLVTLGCILTDFRYKALSLLRDRNLSVQDSLSVHVIPVQRLICAAVGLDDSSVQTYAGKDASTARVSEDFRVHLKIGRRRRIASDRPRGRRCVCSNLELVAKQMLEAFAVAKHHNHIRRRTAKLKAEASAADG